MHMEPQSPPPISKFIGEFRATTHDTVVVMPATKSVPDWSDRFRWQMNGGVVEAIGVTAPFEFVTDAMANLEVVVGGDGHIAGVGEAVDVGSQKEAVPYAVGTALAERVNVGCLEDLHRALLGDGTAAAVGLGHHDRETPPPKRDFTRHSAPRPWRSPRGSVHIPHERSNGLKLYPKWL